MSRLKQSEGQKLHLLGSLALSLVQHKIQRQKTFGLVERRMLAWIKLILAKPEPVALIYKILVLLAKQQGAL